MREALEITYWDDGFADAFREAGMPAVPADDRDCAERLLARMEAGFRRVERSIASTRPAGSASASSCG